MAFWYYWTAKEIRLCHHIKSVAIVNGMGCMAPVQGMRGEGGD